MESSPEPGLVREFRSAFKERRLPLEQEQAEAMALYLQLLERWNETHNLTAIRDRQAAILRHFVEPAIALPLLSGAGPILLDAGSGAGIPGLPLKILDADRTCMLVEANGKKAAFLREVVERVGLEDVEVLEGRFEELVGSGELAPPINILTARAWTGWGDLLGLAARLMVPGGRAVIFIGEETMRALRRHLGAGPGVAPQTGDPAWMPAARAGWQIRRVLPLPHLDRASIVALELPAD